MNSFRHPIGMELWTYRRELARDLPGTLKMIRELGITDVEAPGFFGHTAAEFRTLLDAAGLKCTSFVVQYERMQSDLDGALADAKAVGARFIIVSWIPHKGDLTEEQVHQAGRDFNQWGQKLRDRGINFGYHPHGFEFGHTKTATLFDILAAETSPQFVTFELDTFWFRQGGVDPARYLEKYPARFQLMHLKDLASDTKEDLTGGAPESASVVVGNGSLHWPEILRAAKNSAITEYFIEDESPNPVQQVPATLKYMRQIQF